MTAFRPIPDDPTADVITDVFDADASWLLATRQFDTGAVETFMRDGSGWQLAVAVRVCGRLNKTNEEAEMRLLMSPDDALAFARAIAHSAVWAQTKGTR